MIRQDLSERLQRNRETLAFAVLALGFCFLCFGVFRNLSLQVLSLMAALSAALLSFLAWRRSVLRQGSGGLGVVEINERAITYFGPSEGWEISLDTLQRVSISTEITGDIAQFHWVFEAELGTFLTIPNSALGADKIAERLAFLNHIDLEMAVQVAKGERVGVFEIWRGHDRTTLPIRNSQN